MDLNSTDGSSDDEPPPPPPPLQQHQQHQQQPVAIAAPLPQAPPSQPTPPAGLSTAEVEEVDTVMVEESDTVEMEEEELEIIVLSESGDEQASGDDYTTPRPVQPNAAAAAAGAGDRIQKAARLGRQPAARPAEQPTPRDPPMAKRSRPPAAVDVPKPVITIKTPKLAATPLPQLAEEASSGITVAKILGCKAYPKARPGSLYDVYVRLQFSDGRTTGYGFVDPAPLLRSAQGVAMLAAYAASHPAVAPFVLPAVASGAAHGDAPPAGSAAAGPPADPWLHLLPRLGAVQCTVSGGC